MQMGQDGAGRGVVTGAPRLILLSGARGAGKTVAAARLGAALSMGVIRLDRYFVRYKTVTRCEDTSREAARLIARQLITDLIDARSRAVLEGGWILPKLAAELRDTHGLEPVFLGFPGAWPKKRLKAIRDGAHLSPTGRSHNLAWLDEDEALEIVGRQIGLSRWQQTMCRDLDIPYFDMTDFSAGSAAMAAHFGLDDDDAA
ncbi:hypothetical protein roselon_03295 [Roseibacterium elongatum DSM 19469]|uniref:Adenylate kinase n=1 Tax=Roseicyclus elongatus DSM 19469 TaxID=1294273 RepID=W8RW67_9RHOB|nr:hypothetical protein [Roseibacterium elongatum]AHM05553.1 hypothetical protein roselon_03295 [Roseibacterium elongatum DSM 19469]